MWLRKSMMAVPRNEDLILTELTAKKSLSREQLSKKCDDNLFLRLSTQITQSIVILALSLNLTVADAEQIKQDNNDERTKRVKTLFKWRRKNGSDATYLSLVKVFIQDEKRELAEFVMDYFSTEIQVDCSTSGPSDTPQPLTSNKAHTNQENLEIKSKPRPEYRSQLSMPNPNQRISSSGYTRSKSHPVHSSPRLPRYAKQPNNSSWQVFDKYYDKIIDSLSQDQALCSEVYVHFHTKFLINDFDKYVIDQLTCPAIKNRAIMEAVGTFFSRSRKFETCLRKLVEIFSNFQKTKMLSAELKEEALKMGAYKHAGRLKHEGISKTSDFPFDDVDKEPTLILPDCIHKYADHLRACYKRWKPDPKWSPARTKLYVDLAVVENDPIHNDKFSKSTLHRSVDDILRKKTPISLEELCEIPLESLYLIEGAPGIGKSMLAFELCRRWVDKEALQHYSVLFLLQLRDKTVQKLSSVEDLLGYFLRSQSWKQEAIQTIIDSSGKDVLIVLEGFDELPEYIANNKQSVFFELINTLPRATIIITSRPSAKPYFNKELCFRQHIEVLGFTKDNISKYVRKFFEGNDLLLHKFNEYLQQFPKLEECLHIPIILVIVLDVFNEQFLSDTQFTQSTTLTYTELYEMLIRMLIYCYLKDQNPGKNFKFACLEELPQQELDEFHSLCGLAYSGLINDQRQRRLIFYEDSLNTVGLMQKELQILASEGGDVIAYSFLHLTIQEFLAAYHIHLMEPQDVQRHFNKFNHTISLSNVMLFLAGLTRLQSVSLFVPSQIYHLNIFHQLYETKDDQRISDILSIKDITQKTKKVSRVLPIPNTQEMYLLGYCIALSQCTWQLTFTLREITDEHFDMFISGLTNKDIKPRYHIEDINVSLNPLGNKGITSLLCLPQHVLNNLLSLRLRGIGVDVGCLDELVKKWQHLYNIQKFIFCNNHFESGEQLPLIAAVCHSKMIQHLSFSKLSTDECSMLLTDAKSVHTLEICQLSPPSIEAIIKSLSNSISLETLQIRQSEIKANLITYLPITLPSSHLKSLEFINCAIDSDTVCVIADAVKKTPSLEKLNLSDNLIDDKGGHYLAGIIHSVILSSQTDKKSHFKELYVDHNLFTESTITNFIDVLLLCHRRSFLKIHLSLKWKEHVQSHSMYHEVLDCLQFGNIED